MCYSTEGSGPTGSKRTPLKSHTHQLICLNQTQICARVTFAEALSESLVMWINSVQFLCHTIKAEELNSTIQHFTSPPHLVNQVSETACHDSLLQAAVCVCDSEGPQPKCSTSQELLRHGSAGCYTPEKSNISHCTFFLSFQEHRPMAESPLLGEGRCSQSAELHCGIHLNLIC